MDRKFIAAMTGLLVTTLGTVAVLRDHHAPAAIDASADDRQRDKESDLPAVHSASVQEHAFLGEESPDAALLVQVEHKYRYLFADLDPAYVDELKRRLLERESEAAMTRRAQADTAIGELLPAREFAYYQVLKDSDFEQHHLTEYTGGISNVAPLDDRQQRLVLEAKLRQKQRYATVMRDVGLDRDTLSPEEREYAHAHAVEALKGYLDEFLQDVSTSLTSEQYTLLRSYETTEFSRELERLQQRINGK